jgi:hypothetical protein
MSGASREAIMSLPKTEVVPIAAGEQIDPSSAPTAESAPSIELAFIAEAVLEDHAELDKTVSQLRELCLALCGNQAIADPGPAALIEEFECQLILHLAAEEAEEFFGSLVTEQPSLLLRVERLQAEHGRMAEALDQVLESAKSGAPGPELAERITRFLNWFDAHEHAENALMQEFFLLDQGGCG